MGVKLCKLETLQDRRIPPARWAGNYTEGHWRSVVVIFSTHVSRFFWQELGQRSLQRSIVGRIVISVGRLRLPCLVSAYFRGRVTSSRQSFFYECAVVLAVPQLGSDHVLEFNGTLTRVKFPSEEGTGLTEFRPVSAGTVEC